MSLLERYASSWLCKHQNKTTRLLNREWRCDECMSVAFRADGTRPIYLQPERVTADGRELDGETLAQEAVTEATA